MKVRFMNIDLDTNINHRLATVAAQNKRLVFRVIAEQGLSITPDQWTVLHYLWKKDGLTIGELVTHTKKDFANVTRVVERLVRDGYIQKLQNPDDHRSYCVFVLPKANEIKDAVQNVFHIMVTLSLKDLSETEQNFLLEILAKIENNVEKQLEQKT